MQQRSTTACEEMANVCAEAGQHHGHQLARHVWPLRNLCDGHCVQQQSVISMMNYLCLLLCSQSNPGYIACPPCLAAAQPAAVIM
jgi:hypothetical protein